MVEPAALAARTALREGRSTVREVVEMALARIEESEPDVRAWQFLDPAHARAQADALDAARAEGEPIGPLFGLPVGVKDIVDTADMPTENGTAMHAGRQPERDAALVTRLRAAGAVILGKTVTTELAVYTPGKTRNPHDITRTPGGSSSGSAAAVACGMVPLAIATQTNGSVIRPAAFCGVVGYKPTHGSIPRTGVLAQSPPLDTVGVMATSVADAALLAQNLFGFDSGDPGTRPRATPPLLEVARQDPPMPPRFAFVRTPVWDQAEPDLTEAFAGLVQRLGDACVELELASAFDRAHEIHCQVMEADLAWSFGPLLRRRSDGLSARLREMMTRGAEVTAVAYHEALADVPDLRTGFHELLDGIDAVITPSAAGEAPRGLDSTGSPAFCTIWTLLGVPSITLPLLTGASGMPIGVQLIGRHGDDARLLRTAAWLERLYGAA